MAGLLGRSIENAAEHHAAINLKVGLQGGMEWIKDKVD